jgi:hypothetical protein
MSPALLVTVTAVSNPAVLSDSAVPVTVPPPVR